MTEVIGDVDVDATATTTTTAAGDGGAIITIIITATTITTPTTESYHGLEVKEVEEEVIVFFTVWYWRGSLNTMLQVIFLQLNTTTINSYILSSTLV